MIELKNKWRTLGKEFGSRLAGSKDKAEHLKERFDSLNLSPKNTFIEIQNFCMEEGLTQDLHNDMIEDVKGMEPAELERERMKLPEPFRGLVDEVTDLRGEFSAGCAWEIVKKMSEVE